MKLVRSLTKIEIDMKKSVAYMNNLICNTVQTFSY